MEKGRLIEFRVQGDRRLAVVDRPDGKKNWIVIDGQNQSHSLHPRQITYEIPGETFTPSGIKAFQLLVEPFLDPSGLELAWEFMVEEGEMADPQTLAEFLFSSRNSHLCYAAYVLLSEDKVYFKQKGDRYEPRSSGQVAEIKHQMAVELQRQQEWQNFLGRVHRAIAGEGVQWESSDRLRLEILERFALLGDEATQRSVAQELLRSLERPETSQGAFNLLVDLSLWTVHENLYLRQSQIPTQFPTKVLEMVQSCMQRPVPDPDPQRLDLTHLKVYTIDDESTREIDDGLSVEFLPDGRERLWIHIADPTRWLLPGDDLDLEARRRGTTLYLPTGSIPMFPTELATGPMSLVQGQECCALSFGVLLGLEGNIEDFEIYTSRIRPTYRLTYDDADEMLELGIEAERELGAIAHWSNARRNWRRGQGAITIDMPEASIKVKDDEITIDVLENSISRQLVAEMMILAGEVAARYGQAHNLAVPFRNQSQPELPPEDELQLLPAGPVRGSAIRRCMPRSEISLTPSRHASLGLDTYVQVTSPIRRYSDLLTHFQIKAHLRGEPLPFSVSEVQDLVSGLSATVQEAVWVERQTNRYWGLEYLRRHPEEIWQALVLRWLREDEGLALVMLEELGLEFAARLNRQVFLGDRIQLQVTHADPRQDVIQFRELQGTELHENVRA